MSQRAGRRKLKLPAPRRCMGLNCPRLLRFHLRLSAALKKVPPAERPALIRRLNGDSMTRMLATLGHVYWTMSQS